MRTDCFSNQLPSHELLQTARQQVRRDAGQAIEELVEARRACVKIAQNEERPAIADAVERASDGTE
jgi:hypothetical protein